MKKKVKMEEHYTMSQPTIPMLSPETMRDVAYNLLLASIAMEEIGLNNISDGDKIKQIAGILIGNENAGEAVGRILEINKIIGSLVDAIMQNQTLIKGRLEKILSALRYNLKRQTIKTGETVKSSAESQTSTANTKNTQDTPDTPVVTSPQETMPPKDKDEPVIAEHKEPISDTLQKSYVSPNVSAAPQNKADTKEICHNTVPIEAFGAPPGYEWHKGDQLPWFYVCSNCCHLSLSGEKTRIILRGGSCYLVSFSATVISSQKCPGKVSVALQTMSLGKRKTEFRTAAPVISSPSQVTLSGSGIVIPTYTFPGDSYLMLTLEEPSCVDVDYTYLSIIEI